MGALKTIARRTFLIGSAAIAGGVAFGIYKVKQDPANPLLKTAKSGEAVFNPWVMIDGERITLITPHTDLGQGAESMQAALIAEELDLDFGQFETSVGVPAAAYWNTAMAGDAAPFKSTDDSFTAETTRSVMGGVFKLIGMQGTGGSSSVPDSFDKLRMAGAVARETLKAAVAKNWDVPVGELKTAEGTVILPDGTALKYTEVAALAAEIEPVEDVALRDPSEWRLIGSQMRRLDIVGKSTGALKYGIDLDIEGMVHATVKVNPRQGGVMNAYDASDAEKMFGVIKVLPVTNGAAVVAENTWYAFQAVDAISFDWGAAPYPAEQADHWLAVADSFTEERLDKVWREDGDPDAALSGDVVEAEYRAPYLAHAPLEPLNAVVKVTEEGVDIWVSHQIPRIAQQQVAAITGHETEQVKLHGQYAGGSFGHRLEFDNVRLAAEIANQMRGTPVKLTYSREEDFAHDYPRQISMARGRGAVKDGKVEAYDLSIASVSSSASQIGRIGMSMPGPDAQIPAGAWNLPYAVPNFRVSAYRVPELAPTSSWRSVGASSAGFFADCLLDELIHAAGADPLEERLRLCTHDLARKTLEAVGEMSGWGGDLGPDRGRGVAFVNSFGVPCAEVVEVTNTPDGIKIDKVFVAAEVGTVVDPVAFDNQVKGGVVWALGHAMNCELTYADGIAEQSNYHAFEAMRMYQCPQIEVRGLENGDSVRGVGEPPVPPAAAALANAIFAATGKRLREMPFNKHIDFV